MIIWLNNMTLYFHVSILIAVVNFVSRIGVLKHALFHINTFSYYYYFISFHTINCLIIFIYYVLKLFKNDTSCPLDTTCVETSDFDQETDILVGDVTHECECIADNHILTDAEVCLPAKPNGNVFIELATGFCDKDDWTQEDLVNYAQTEFFSDVPAEFNIIVLAVIINHKRCSELNEARMMFENALFDAIIISDNEYDADTADWDEFLDNSEREIYETTDEEFDIIVENYDLEELLPMEPDVSCRKDEEFDTCSNGECYANCESVYMNEVVECSNASDICPGPGACLCAPGTYRVKGPFSRCVPVEKCPHAGCAALEGYAYDYDLHACLDINECDDTPCGDGVDCINYPGTYECACDTGYEVVDDACVDIDECQLLSRDVQCGLNTNCFNTPGSFFCNCSDGFNWAEDGACANENECRLDTHTCGDNSFCVDIPGDFVCVCNAGYTAIDDICEDVDECATDSNDCESRNADCANTDGNYICTCREGFAFDNTGNCFNIDECAVGIDSCDPVSETCYDTSGSHYCECRNGFQSNGDECIDVNECGFDDLDVCGINSVCMNHPGGYTCRCKPGYTLLDRFTQVICVDINECDLGLDNCKMFSSCVNTRGSFTCQCINGYMDNGDDCEDIDECLDEFDYCGKNSECRNTAGSFECECLAGFTSDGDMCVDDDECLTPEVTTCSYNSGALCNNIDGSYECYCPSGMDGSGINGDPCVEQLVCDDPNEEVVDCANQQCFATCITFLNNKPDRCPTSTDECMQGCACKDGYVRKKPNTECVLESECTCRSGFEHVDGICQDIDECAGGVDSCNVDVSTCANNIGAFDCVCNSGYIMTNEGECQDIDECASAENRCGAFGTCVNTPGNYECSCEDGYELDGFGFSCIDIDECEVAESCPSLSTCTNTDGGHLCKCNDGHAMNEASNTCDDVDECTHAVHTCDRNADCANTDGSYECACKDGFELRTARNGDEKCRNINECSAGTDTCGANSACRDTIGSYSCVCKTGFHTAVDVEGCSDVNECQTNTHRCNRNSDCENTEGSFVCNCHDGFEQEGKHKCSDIDECSVGTSDCAVELSACLNTIGGFECACPIGFDGEGTLDEPCVAECNATISTPSDCINDQTCYHTCESYTWKQNETCPDFSECETGCLCLEDYVKLDSSFDSECVNQTECPIPECPVNEEFSRCGNNCYSSCDDPNPSCSDDCSAGCNCKEGFVKPSSESDEACIAQSACKLIVDLTCADNEHAVEEFDPCHLMCENVRTESNRTDCDPDAKKFAGCECNDGFTRLTSDPNSPCVPSNECTDKYNGEDCESFNLIEVVQEFSLRVDTRNRRTWYHLKAQFADAGFQEMHDAMSVVDMKKIEPDFVLPGQEVINEWAVGYQIVMCPKVNKGDIDDMLDAIDNYNLLAEWDRDFHDLQDDLDIYFPCYEQDCDDNRLDCDRTSQFIGCPNQDQPTCLATLDELMQSQSDLFQELFGRLECRRQCVCKPGYFRADDSPDAECVPFDQCFGGCPRHSDFNKAMPFCTGFCKDPEADRCRIQTQDLANWESLEDTLRIPGCQCREKYVREKDHPWSACVPEVDCVRPEPDCGAMGIENAHWDWNAPVCFPSCHHPFPYDDDDRCMKKLRGMCVCDEGFYKERPNKKANCVSLETCFADKCDSKKGEEFSTCVPKCFDDCRSFWYDGVEEQCHDWASEDCKLGCVCQEGYVRKNGFDHIHGFGRSKCYKVDKCKKPATDTVNVVGQVTQLLDGIDLNDPSTWTALLELLGLSDNPHATILNLLQTGNTRTEDINNHRYQKLATARTGEYSFVVQVVVETTDANTTTTEELAEQVAETISEAAVENDVVIVEEGAEEFDEIIETNDVTIPDAPSPTPRKYHHIQHTV